MKKIIIILTVSVPEIIVTVFAKTSPKKRSFSMTEYERFGLVITKTLVYKFGHICRAKFLVPDWGIWNIVDSGIGLSYNPT